MPTNTKNYAPKRSIISSIAAFIGYGTWSAFANYNHGFEMVTKIVLIYGAYSAVATLIYSNVMEYVFQRCSNNQYNSIITIIITCTIMYSTSVFINILIGTPELLLTIAPGIIISTIFAMGYVKILQIKIKPQKI